MAPISVALPLQLLLLLLLLAAAPPPAITANKHTTMNTQ
jgi:hypothetical protein